MCNFFTDSTTNICKKKKSKKMIFYFSKKFIYIYLLRFIREEKNIIIFVKILVHYGKILKIV
jgi:hypothetical protein